MVSPHVYRSLHCRLAVVFAIAAAVLLVPGSLPAAEAAPGLSQPEPALALVEPVVPPPGMRAPGDEAPSGRAVVRIDRLRQQPSRFTIEPVYGDRLTVNLGPAEGHPAGALTWSGTVEGEEFSSVTIASAGGATRIEIWTMARVIRIEPGADDEWYTTIIEAAEYGDDYDPAPIEPPIAGDPGLGGPAAADSGDEIDVLVLYTDDTRAAAGGTGAIESLITTAVANTNTAYGNSQVVHRLRLVGMVEVNYAETGNPNTDLGNLQVYSGGTGALDIAQTLREIYHADLVSLIVESMPSACGIGYVNKDASHAQYGFSVVRRTCATAPQNSFAHELGHNMGSTHDPINDSGVSSTACENGKYTYSCGYQHPNRTFRTIMAYDCPGGGCPRIPYFSNPDVNYNLAPTGTADKHNNTLSLNNMASIIANFRDAPDGACFAQTTNASGPGSVSRSPSNATGCSNGHFFGGSAVSLTATANPGYVFQGWSATGGGSFLCDDCATTLFSTPSAAHTVTATFVAAPCYPLTTGVNPASSGTVSVQTAQDCTGGYTSGKVVSIQANPAGGYAFSHWVGATDGASTTVTMTGPKTVTANFSQLCYPLTTGVSPASSGTVSVQTPQDCTGGFTHGKVVSIQASAAQGYSFSSWTGASGGASTTVTMTGPKTVTANFTQVCFSASASATPAVGGTATIETAPNCGSGYSFGTNITVSIVANSGWTFIEWEGDGSGSVAPASLAVTGNVTFVARFAPEADRIETAPEIPAGSGAQTFDVSFMTSSQGDPAIVSGPGCQGGTLANSTWIQVPADDNGVLRVATVGSSFSPAIAIFSGMPGDLDQLACGTGTLSVAATPGTTYWVALGSWTALASGSLKVEVIGFERGDMTCSGGAADAADVLAALQMLTGIIAADASCPANPDLAPGLTLIDVLWIQRHLAGLA